MGDKTKRVKLHQVDIEKDIRYRGPLSYRHFKILGWLCIALSQVVFLASFIERISPETAASYSILITILSSVASLSVPFLLFANFSQILDDRDGYKRPMITFGLASGLIIMFFLIIYYRYVIGIGSKITGQEPGAVISALNDLFSHGTANGSLAFNLFMDVLLCTLFMFFLNYRPSRFFTGKKLYIFRAFMILPVAYEIASMVLKGMAAFGALTLPVGMYPFLTTKPPMMFFVFLVLALHLKNRERRFCKYGRTHKEYLKFLETNRNSFQFSKYAAIVLAVAGILDILCAIVLVAITSVRELTTAGGVLDEIQTAFIDKFMNLGIGKSAALIPMAPVMLLFSYTRKYKNTLVDLLIPILGVVLIVFIYLEAINLGAGFLAGSIFK